MIGHPSVQHTVIYPKRKDIVADPCRQSDFLGNLVGLYGMFTDYNDKGLRMFNGPCNASGPVRRDNIPGGDKAAQLSSLQVMTYGICDVLIGAIIADENIIVHKGGTPFKPSDISLFYAFCSAVFHFTIFSLVKKVPVTLIKDVSCTHPKTMLYLERNFKSKVF